MTDIDLNPAEASLPAEAKSQLPGFLLRRTREAKGLSIGDIAQALKFSPRQLEAIEADDHAGLPGTTFVRGAIRSYARYLKLDPIPLLALLDATAPAALPDVRPPQNMGTAMSDRGGRLISPLFILSFLLLLLTALIGAWHYLGGVLSIPPSEPATAVSPVEAPQPVVSPPALVEPTPVENPPAQVAPAPVPASPAAAPAAPTAASPQSGSPQPPSSSAPAVAPVAPAAPAPAVSQAGTRQLVFLFAARSWVELRDASNQVIFTGEQMPGSRQAITGRPPFQLIIGNAAKVELTDGERKVDLRPYTRAEVARLTLN